MRPTRRSHAPEGREPQLVLRFAVVTALSLAIAGALVLFVIRNLDVRNAEREGIARAQLATDVLFRPNLGAVDLAAPVRGERRTALDRLLEQRLSADSMLRVSVVRPDGLVVYSSDHRTIGRRIGSPEHVTESLVGDAVGATGTLAGTKVLTTYVPIVVGPGRQRGAIVTDVDYAAVASSADDVFFPVAGVFEVAFVGLFLLLVPSLASASRRLRRHAAELSHRASHDDLTGLPNRREFAAETDRRLSKSDHVAVLLVDLDRFKEINDALGHAAGDMLLQDAARRLRDAVGGATVARLGGDEFAIVATVAGRDEALALSNTVREAVEKPFGLLGFTVQLGSSVGVALAPAHGHDADVLLQHADHAMYEAKRLGGGSMLYDPRDDEGGIDRLTLMAELREAIEEGALDVWFQPIVSLDTAEAHAVEALVRWHHPTRGLLTAAAFVPLAEQTGMIRALNRLVIAKALAQQARWSESEIDVDVTVNLTMIDLLDTSLPDAVEMAIATAGTTPSALVLEITETTAMTDSIRVRETLDRLRAMGVRLAIDDFGTGHSSLAYLQHLPVQIMKIDKSFVHEMIGDRGATAIIRSTIELGRSLGLTVVAEGIETLEQWDELRSLGCGYGQGYYLSPPMPVEELLGLGEPSASESAAA